MDRAVEEIDHPATSEPSDASVDFHSEPEGNIWDQPVEEEEDDTPAFLRRRKKQPKE